MALLDSVTLSLLLSVFLVILLMNYRRVISALWWCLTSPTPIRWMRTLVVRVASALRWNRTRRPRRRETSLTSMEMVFLITTMVIWMATAYRTPPIQTPTVTASMTPTMVR